MLKIQNQSKPMFIWIFNNYKGHYWKVMQIYKDSVIQLSE